MYFLKIREYPEILLWLKFHFNELTKNMKI